MALLAFFFPLLTALPTSPDEWRGEPAIDPVSRNIMQSQGGSVRDSMGLTPPPVRREYVEER